MTDTMTIERLWDDIYTLLAYPTTNLRAALLLYGIIGLLLLIVLIVAIMFLVSAGPDEEEAEGESAAAEKAAPAAGVSAAKPRKVRVRRPPTPRSRAITAAIAVAVIAVAWGVAGYSTSEPAVCAGCHITTPHTDADPLVDPHAGLTCVRCHEPAGALARYTTNVPSRLVHFIDGWQDSSAAERYGTLTGSACATCHGDDIDETTVDESRGLRMSHREPLDAGARCTDCHIPRDGVVGRSNAGMNPCLRCHDSVTASAECETCHEKGAAAAARGDTASLATQQVDEVRCGGCHDQEKECDSCHGLRMPHSPEFRAYAHARAGAVDFWYNQGRTCGACHTQTRRPCQRCHGPFLGSGHPPTMAETHQGATESACNTCHQQWATSRQRDFCVDVCHTPAAIEASPR